MENDTSFVIPDVLAVYTFALLIITIIIIISIFVKRHEIVPEIQQFMCFKAAAAILNFAP